MVTITPANRIKARERLGNRNNIADCNLFWKELVEAKRQVLIDMIINVNMSKQLMRMNPASVRPAPTILSVLRNKIDKASSKHDCTLSPAGCRCQPTKGVPSYDSSIK